MSAAYIVFELDGRRYEYDGGFPAELADRVAALCDADGFWLGGYPAAAFTGMKDERDDLPAVLWEIGHLGGRVLEIQGAGASGAIHPEDWRNPRLY